MYNNRSIRYSNKRGRRNTSRRSGRFHGQSRRKGNSQKIDISSFINKLSSANVKEEVFVPEHAFSDFSLSAPLIESLKKKGYNDPTPIQDKIIEPILNGQDVVGLANTGTGKTAAFLIPLIELSIQNPEEQILVIAPTRELAIQVEEELKTVMREMGLYSLTCVGGEHIKAQMRKLKLKNHFIIGTPGRLLDLVKRGHVVLGDIDRVVLDEADRMLDMGFINDIKLLMRHAPTDRQTLCFSATMSEKIEVLIKDFLKDPVTISVKKTETPKNIKQDIIRIRNLNKVDILYDLLLKEEFKKVLVFGGTKRGVETLSRTLIKRGIKVESIHSDKSQAQRKRALLKFKDDRVQALVATDIAARGLHVDNITHVINYEIPESYDDYIHRIGRTGRGEKQGKALTFVK